jgi:hypothetical protein
MDDKDEMKRIPIHTISTLPRYGWFPDEIELYHAGDYVKLQDVLNCVVPSSGNAAPEESELRKAIQAYRDLQYKIRTAGRPPHSDYWCQSVAEAGARIDVALGTQPVIASVDEKNEQHGFTAEEIGKLAMSLIGELTGSLAGSDDDEEEAYLNGKAAGIGNLHAELLKLMKARPAAPAVLSERAAKLTDKRIFAIRDSIKPGDGWDGDQWDLAIAYAIESAIAGQPGEKK